MTSDVIFEDYITCFAFGRRILVTFFVGMSGRTKTGVMALEKSDVALEFFKQRCRRGEMWGMGEKGEGKLMKKGLLLCSYKYNDGDCWRNVVK